MKPEKLTLEQIQRRFEEINQLPPEELTPEEEASLAEARAMDDGVYTPLKDIL